MRIFGRKRLKVPRGSARRNRRQAWARARVGRYGDWDPTFAEFSSVVKRHSLPPSEGAHRWEGLHALKKAA